MTPERQKEIAKLASARYRSTHPERVAAQRDAYRENNPDAVASGQARYYTKNAERRKAASTAWRKANPERYRDAQLKCCYGIGVAEYDRMLASQGGVCASCLKPETALANGRWKRTTETKRLAVDHDHNTGRVRGLLCGACNRALGALKDNIDTVRRLATYLERTAG